MNVRHARLLAAVALCAAPYLACAQDGVEGGGANAEPATLESAAAAAAASEAMAGWPAPSGYETELQPLAATDADEASSAATADAAAAAAAEVADSGIASWYGPRFHGRRTASGERFDMHALTAAHRSLPFGTVVRVEVPGEERSVEVRINDRGPHIKKRVIDLSRAAAQALGLLELGGGLKNVIVRIIKMPVPAGR